MTPDDLKDLTKAYHLLNSPSIAMKAANIIGQPLEIALDSLPESGVDPFWVTRRL